jgi:Tol biopolymer transport system component
MVALVAAVGLTAGVAPMVEASQPTVGPSEVRKDPGLRADSSASLERVSVSSRERQGSRQSWVGKSAVSASGRFVAFSSTAPNLVRRDTNGFQDAFVRDRGAGTTQRVSVSSTGRQANGNSSAVAISDDGNLVLFRSDAANLRRRPLGSHAFLHNRRSGRTSHIPMAYSNIPVGLSGNGRFVTYIDYFGPKGDWPTLKVYDRERHLAQPVSISNSGRVLQVLDEHDTSISADGRFIAFTTSTGLRIRDRVARRTIAITRKDPRVFGRNEEDPDLTSRGRFVVFDTQRRLLPRDTNHISDIYVFDRASKTNQLVTVSRNGGATNGMSYYPVISAHGRFVAFGSEASNLVRGDENNRGDLFLYDRRTRTTRCLSIGPAGRPRGGALDSAISGDGHSIAFSTETKLLASDTNGERDVYLAEISP